MTYKQKLQAFFDGKKEITANNTYLGWDWNLSDKQYKNLKKKQIVEGCIIFNSKNFIEQLLKGIIITENSIIKCKKTIKLCGTTPKYAEAKKSCYRDIGLYKKDILKKKEAIEYYKQVISFCEGL